MQTSSIETRLWEAADQLRANSKLTQTEYSMPVLGLIFLRYAYNRFLTVKVEIEESLPARRGSNGKEKRPIQKEDFLGKSALFLPETARYDYLIKLPQGQSPTEAINKAMEDIEKENQVLSGVLPKEYHLFEEDLLERLLKIFNDDEMQKMGGDVFGRIYEYFLMKFAMGGAQEKGEFFTPISLVQTIVNIIEPDHGTVLDPACGSGGMFVQSGHFITDHQKSVSQTVTFYGQEKTKQTIRLAKMNLAVHGLEGNIAEANTFYEDAHNLVGKADFVMANPPFNVDGVDADKIKTDPRLPFGLPGTTNKGKQVSSANYLWISYFYSYLCEKGRAGFVMSSQASSAGGADRDVRQKLVETGHVDVMISIRSDFFYTLSVPCELWFFNKNKNDSIKDKVLMIDARHIYTNTPTKAKRNQKDFSKEQLKNIKAIVHLYRKEKEAYLEIIKNYFLEISEILSGIPDMLKTYIKLISAVDGLDVKKELEETKPSLKKSITSYSKTIDTIETNAKQKKAYEAFTNIEETLKELKKNVERSYKDLLTHFKQTKASRTVKADIQEHHDNLLNTIKSVFHIAKQISWLQSRFPDAVLADVPGLVKLTDRKEIAENDYSLTPGRYVGVAPEEEDEDFDFSATMSAIHAELAELNDEAVELAEIIQSNYEELGL